MTAATPVRPPRRPFWADLRFVLGIVLIVASVAGVGLVVSLANQTRSVYVAATTLVPGQPVTEAEVTAVDIGLGTVVERYLAEGDLTIGAVATRTILEGELIAATAIGDAESTAVTKVVVRSSVDVPADISAGDLVDLWASTPLESGVFGTPRVLVPEATIVSVRRDDSMMGGGAAQVEIVIARSDVSATLEAMTNGSALSIVPTIGAGE